MKRHWYGIVGLCMCAGMIMADEVRVISLQETLQLALETDERIEMQRREMSIAGLEVDRAWAIISPRLEASGRYERPKEELRRDAQVVVPEDSWRGTVTARQPLFDGRVLPARRAGQARESAEMQTLIHQVRSALFEVTERYYAALSAQEQVQIAQQTLDLASDEVKRATARHDAGEARNTEKLRAEVDAARANRNLVAARNTSAVTISDLARRMGIPADQPFAVQAPAAVTPPAVESLDALYRVALDERNDLRAARARQRAAREERTVIRRDGWPKVDLEYNHRFVDPESFSARNNFWDVAAVARIDIWDGGNRRISRVQQEQRIDQTELRIRELEKQIELEVMQALLDLQTLRENIDTLRKEVHLAGENYRTLSEQARVGLATSLDVSTALNAMDQARTELSRQQFDLEVAVQRLRAVTGTFADEFIPNEEP